ncbi:hypothetical protein GCM10027343_33220 [Noviherbaspirillum agri]
MQTSNWSQDMSLGVPEMDQAHKDFLEKLATLLTVSDEQFGPAFLAQVARMEHDFREEEDLMEELDYPGIAGHQEQHARILGTLHQVASRVMEGDIALGREAVVLLPQWFAFHLSTMDTALAFALDIDREEKHSAMQTTKEGT